MVDVGICGHCKKSVGTNDITNTLRWVESETPHHATISVHKDCLQFVDRWADHVKAKAKT